METVVFSASMDCPEGAEISVRRHLDSQVIAELSQQANGPIYLCGGGQFAGALLQIGLIDRVILKRAPIILGSGVSLFGQTHHARTFRRVSTKPDDNGYVLEAFAL